MHEAYGLCNFNNTATGCVWCYGFLHVLSTPNLCQSNSSLTLFFETRNSEIGLKAKCLRQEECKQRYHKVPSCSLPCTFAYKLHPQHHVYILRPTSTISPVRVDRSALSLRWTAGHSFCKPSEISRCHIWERLQGWIRVETIEVKIFRTHKSKGLCSNTKWALH
jgi:hypothetical protein